MCSCNPWLRDDIGLKSELIWTCSEARDQELKESNKRGILTSYYSSLYRMESWVNVSSLWMQQDFSWERLRGMTKPSSGWCVNVDSVQKMSTMAVSPHVYPKDCSRAETSYTYLLLQLYAMILPSHLTTYNEHTHTQCPGCCGYSIRARTAHPVSDFCSLVSVFTYSPIAPREDPDHGRTRHFALEEPSALAVPQSKH